MVYICVYLPSHEEARMLSVEDGHGYHHSDDGQIL